MQMNRQLCQYLYEKGIDTRRVEMFELFYNRTTIRVFLLEEAHSFMAECADGEYHVYLTKSDCQGRHSLRGNFIFWHELGHVLLSDKSEKAADKFACSQIKGDVPSNIFYCMGINKLGRKEAINKIRKLCGIDNKKDPHRTLWRRFYLYPRLFSLVVNYCK